MFVQAPAGCCLKGGICGGGLSRPLACLVEGEPHMLMWVPAGGERQEGSLGCFEASLWQPEPAGPFCDPGNEKGHPYQGNHPCSSQGCPACGIPTNSNKPPLTCGSYIKTQQVFPRLQDQSRKAVAVAPCFPTEQTLTSPRCLPPLSGSEEIALIKKKIFKCNLQLFPMEKIASHQVSSFWQFQAPRVLSSLPAVWDRV